MSASTDGPRKTLKLLTTHAVRGRLTLKEGEERQFRIESTYRELQSTKETQRNSNETQNTERYSNVLANTNTNSLVHLQLY